MRSLSPQEAPSMATAFPFRRILFPFDFSETAAAMAPLVSAMAKKFEAPVTVVHAFNRIRSYDLTPYFDGSSWQEPTPIPYIPAVQALRDEEERKLDAFVGTRLQGIECSTLLEDGEPAYVIEWAARREKADLIVMTTHGHGRFRRMLPGSVSTKVLHDVECPVLTGAHVADKLPSPHENYESIVCAVRLDAESVNTLRMAALLAQTYRARLCLLHVRMSHDPADPEQAKAAVQSLFDKCMESEGTQGIDLCIRSLNETVSDGIRKAAVEEAADLLVMGRGHARAHLSRIWTHVFTAIRESPCPVLSV
jgi:nucleotide-binding universal stress UspA family protein